MPTGTSNNHNPGATDVIMLMASDWRKASITLAGPILYPPSSSARKNYKLCFLVFFTPTMSVFIISYIFIPHTAHLFPYILASFIFQILSLYWKNFNTYIFNNFYAHTFPYINTIFFLLKLQWGYSWWFQLLYTNLNIWLIYELSIRLLLSSLSPLSTSESTFTPADG